MTVHLVSDDGVTESASHVLREKNKKGALRLLFMVKDRYRDISGDSNARSHVKIIVWTDTPDGGKGGYGYRLSVKRIIELASK